jgi:hypothetical protein
MAEIFGELGDAFAGASEAAGADAGRGEAAAGEASGGGDADASGSGGSHPSGNDQADGGHEGGSSGEEGDAEDNAEDGKSEQSGTTNSGRESGTNGGNEADDEDEPEDEPEEEQAPPGQNPKTQQWASQNQAQGAPEDNEIEDSGSPVESHINRSALDPTGEMPNPAPRGNAAGVDEDHPVNGSQGGRTDEDEDEDESEGDLGDPNDPLSAFNFNKDIHAAWNGTGEETAVGARGPEDEDDEYTE